MRNTKILEFRSNTFREKQDFIAQERPLTIYLNNNELVTLLCTPDSLKELAVGFLASSLLIHTKKDIENIILDEDKFLCWVNTRREKETNELLFKRMLSSGCGQGIMFYHPEDSLAKHKVNSPIKVRADEIINMMSEFQRGSELFLKTGAVHSACLYDFNKVLVLKEDIGRHNALDKIIGYCLLNDIALEDKVILLSGRVSSEIMFKAWKQKISVLISQGAATDQAIKIANKANITLVGFARANKMNIYSGKDRVV